MYISFFHVHFLSYGVMGPCLNIWNLAAGTSTRADRQGLSAIGPYGMVHRGIELARIMRLSHWVRILGIVFRTYARVEL